MERSSKKTVKMAKKAKFWNVIKFLDLHQNLITYSLVQGPTFHQISLKSEVSELVFWQQTNKQTGGGGDSGCCSCGDSVVKLLFLSFPPSFLIWIKGLRFELWLVILGYMNKTDLTWFKVVPVCTDLVIFGRMSWCLCLTWVKFG